jgi:hypothetical protein
LSRHRRSQQPEIPVKSTPFVAASVVASLVASLPAQSFSLAAPVPTVVSIQAATSQQATLNPGPLAASGAVIVGPTLTAPSALFSWTSSASSTQAIFDARVVGWNNAAAGQFSAMPGEVLLQLSAPVTVQVWLVMTHYLFQPTGAPEPTTFVDVFDDGLPELTTIATTPVMTSFGIGPVPTPIRTRLAASHSGIGLTDVTLRLVVLPMVGITTQRWASGCGAGYSALPTFSDTLELRAGPDLGEVMVGVLGLGFQPVFLGMSFSLPCFAFPSPDLLLFPLGVQTLAIPASVRPFQFWTQGVAIGANGFRASDVFVVTAY